MAKNLTACRALWAQDGFDRRHTGCKEKYRNFKSCLRALANSAAKSVALSRTELLNASCKIQGIYMREEGRVNLECPFNNGAKGQLSEVENHGNAAQEVPSQSEVEQCGKVPPERCGKVTSIE